MFIAVGISVIIAMFNFWHILTQWIMNPNGRSYTWIAHYYADFFLYVSQISQGVRGNWIMSSAMYTNEHIPDTWVYWPNVLIGKIGSFTPLSPFALYAAALVLFVLVLLALLYFIMKELFPKQPYVSLLAFFFYATASNFADMRRLLEKGEFAQLYEMWFSPTPALNRFGGVPHQTLQTIMLLLVLLVFARLSAKKYPLNQSIVMGIVFSIMCFLTATLTPIQMLLVCGAMVITLILTHPATRSLLPIVMGLLSAALGAYLVNRAFDASELYAAAKLWEASQTVRATSIDLILAMGPVIVFIPFGVRSFFSRMHPIQHVFFIYGMCSFIIFSTPIPHLLGTSPTRWIHPASFVIFSCLAAEGFFGLSVILTHFFKETTGRQKLTRHIPMILLLVYLFLTIPSLIAQVNVRSSKETASILYSDVNHVPQSAISMFKTLETLPDTGIVLTDPTLPYDAMVPILTGKHSFTGHPVHTLFPQVKEGLRQQFFAGGMDETAAKRFLTDHSIRYLIASQAAARILPPYPFLNASYYNEDITLYEVTK